MDNFLHGKCLNGGSYNIHCQKFIPESGSRNCVDCSHKDSHHVILACKVMCEGYQYLPKPVVDVPAAELNERKSQFGREKTTSSVKTSVKAVGKKLFSILLAKLTFLLKKRFDRCQVWQKIN